MKNKKQDTNKDSGKSDYHAQIKKQCTFTVKRSGMKEREAVSLPKRTSTNP
tara:strand:- start:2 stop:154 length:153 start_codon:yes stop_codon:yes gene_type:complete